MRTYRAILRGDRIEWLGSAPPQDRPMPVEITVMEDKNALPRSARGQAMGQALEALARIDAFADIADPVAWQRDMRRNRSLTGRDP